MVRVSSNSDRTVLATSASKVPDPRRSTAADVSALARTAGGASVVASSSA